MSRDALCAIDAHSPKVILVQRELVLCAVEFRTQCQIKCLGPQNYRVGGDTFPRRALFNCICILFYKMSRLLFLTKKGTHLNFFKRKNGIFLCILMQQLWVSLKTMFFHQAGRNKVSKSVGGLSLCHTV